MTVIGRLKNGDLSINGEINERIPSVTNGLVAHYPFDRTARAYIPNQVRYIRDWIGNSTVSNSHIWYELEAIDYNGINRALGKIATCDTGATSTEITNGDKNTANYWNPISDTLVHNIIIDLSNSYNIKQIKIFHYSGDVRTFHNTKTEVSEDGVHWFAIFDSTIEGEYAETSTGYTIDLTSLGATCKPLTNTNTTLTYDGIAVEEATTNLITNGDFSNGLTGWALSGTTGGTYTTIATTFMGKTCLYQDVGTWSQTNYRSCALTLLASTTYTISFSIYCILGNIIFDSNGPWDTSYVLTSTIGKWVNYSYTFTTNATGGSETFHFYADANRARYFLTNVQLEQKSFPTSFVNGNRSKGRLDLSLTRLTDYTVFGCFIPDSPFKNDSNGYTTTADQSALIRIEDTLKVGGFYFKFYLSGGVTSMPFVDLDGYYGTTHTHQAYEVLAFSPVYYAIRKSGTQVKLKLYQEGIWKTEHVTAIPSDAGLNTIRVGDSTLWNGIHSNLSIYNRSLSDDELNKLIKTNFSINAFGNINALSIKERPNYIPSNAYYYPLDIKIKDEFNVYPSSEESNLIYEDGSVWVGSNTTNLFTNTDFSNGITGWSHTESEMISLGNGIISLRRNVNGTGNFQLAQSLTCTSGDNITISFDCKRISGGLEGTNNFNFGVGVWALTPTWNGTKQIYPLGDGWYHIVTTLPTATNADNIIHTIGLHSFVDDLTITYLIKNFIVTKKPFSEPYTSSMRGASSLEYNLNSSLGLNWNTDWSIIYWKKPMGTFDNTLTGYCLESLGCNSNSVGGGYVYWGKSNGSNTIYSAAPSAITPSDYFNHWHMISLVHSGSTVTIKEWNMGGQTYVRTFGLVNTVVANYYVTQHGYDLKLGGWDNDNPPNAYFKDLIVVKRALTDTEVQSIYNTQMRTYSNTLQINNHVIENVIF